MPAYRTIAIHALALSILYLSSYFILLAIGDKRYCGISPGGIDSIATWPAYCFSEDLHEMHHADGDSMHPELTVIGYLFSPLIYSQNFVHSRSLMHRMDEREEEKFNDDVHCGNVDIHEVNRSRYFTDNGKHQANPMRSIDLSNAPEYEDSIRRLLGTQWSILHSVMGNRQAIIFGKNGAIPQDGDLPLNGHGSWRFRRDKLEIYGEYGELLFVFACDEEASEFRSTDAATRRTIMVPYASQAAGAGRDR
jgi:hypothetical protein